MTTYIGNCPFIWLSLAMSVVVSFCAVLDEMFWMSLEILNLIESVSQGFLTYSYNLTVPNISSKAIKPIVTKFHKEPSGLEKTKNVQTVQVT